MYQFCLNVIFSLSLVFESSCVSAYRKNVLKTRSVFPIDLNAQGGLNPSIIESVTSGTFTAMEQCQNVFRWDRWNCPRNDFARHKKLPANKEVAFTKAIIAAGIVHSITKNCSRGEIKECGCDPQLDGPLPSPTRFFDESLSQNSTLIKGNILLEQNNTQRAADWSWGGCSDDTYFANKLVIGILEHTSKNDTAATVVGRHNYRVGREMVRQTMIKKCRCHGVSGSCSLQTCWMQLAPFQTIAKKLREKYNKASRLSLESVTTSMSLTSNSIKREEKKTRLPAPDNVLVYLEQSPDYCVANSTENWPGTKGRSCSRTKSGSTTLSERRSCRNLCRQCGHRVKKEKRTVKQRCNCNFEWCCSVKCDVCVETVEEFYCI